MPDIAIDVLREPQWARVLDRITHPIMWCINGLNGGSPQLTRPWNNVVFSEISGSVIFNRAKEGVTAAANGDPTACPRSWRMYLPPQFGGWKHYTVIAPRRPYPWHIGWVCADGTIGISQKEIEGAVRMLRAPEPTIWFGVYAHSGTQMPIEEIGEGILGETKTHNHLPLL